MCQTRGCVLVQAKAVSIQLCLIQPLCQTQDLCLAQGLFKNTYYRVYLYTHVQPCVRFLWGCVFFKKVLCTKLFLKKTQPFLKGEFFADNFVGVGSNNSIVINSI